MSRLRASTIPQPPGGEEYLHYSADWLESEESDKMLMLNTLLGTLVLLCVKSSKPHVLVETQFTATEFLLVSQLMEHFPYYCPYDVLYAAYTYAGVSENKVARSKLALSDAKDAGVWDQEMKQVRGALSRARVKLRRMGIEISSILETGYMLLPVGQDKYGLAKSGKEGQ